MRARVLIPEAARASSCTHGSNRGRGRSLGEMLTSSSPRSRTIPVSCKPEHSRLMGTSRTGRSQSERACCQSCRTSLTSASRTAPPKGPVGSSSLRASAWIAASGGCPLQAAASSRERIPQASNPPAPRGRSSLISGVKFPRIPARSRRKAAAGSRRNRATSSRDMGAVSSPVVRRRAARRRFTLAGAVVAGLARRRRVISRAVASKLGAGPVKFFSECAVRGVSCSSGVTPSLRHNQVRVVGCSRTASVVSERC